jgi:hypothetical protein
MDENDSKAREMLRNAMGGSIQRSLAATAARLRESAERLDKIVPDVERIGLPSRLKGQRPITAEDILAEALMVLHTNAPDLGTLARSVADYNREMGKQDTPAEGDERCRVLYAGHRCATEHLPGVAVCFEHLWATARGRGVGNVFPLGSPEPTEKAVPRGVALVGENGVHWLRQGDRWHAGGPAGDGGFYRWDAVNGSGNETGRELARLVPECVL